MLPPVVYVMISSVEDLMEHPLALPIAVGLVTVLLTILLFYNISESFKKSSGAKKNAGKTGESADGSGVRRSTRYVPRWLVSS